MPDTNKLLVSEPTGASDVASPDPRDHIGDITLYVKALQAQTISSCIVGGYPRDIARGVQPRDVDVQVQSDSVNEVADLLWCLGVGGVHVYYSNYSDYLNRDPQNPATFIGSDKTGNAVAYGLSEDDADRQRHGVVSTMINGIKVDFIVSSLTTGESIRKYDASTSMYVFTDVGPLYVGPSEHHPDFGVMHIYKDTRPKRYLRLKELAQDMNLTIKEHL